MADGLKTVVLSIGGGSVVAAGTDAAAYWKNEEGHRVRIVSAEFIPSAAVTANDTNYTDLSIEVAGNEVASEQTTTGDTGNLVKGTAETLVLTAGVNLECEPDEVIEFLKTDAGSGVACGGDCILKLEPMPT